MKIKLNGEELEVIWYNYASFEISLDNYTIFIDPYNVSRDVVGDIILITHGHRRHFSPKDLKRVLCERSFLIAPYEVMEASDKLPGKKMYVIPGDVVNVYNITIWATPAYNVNKFDSCGVPYHPREDLKVGYVIEVEEFSIHHAGDTDKIPEMRGINCDIALLPVGGVSVMTVDEALEAVYMINPKAVVPMHCKRAEITAYATKFKEALKEKKIRVIIPCEV